MVLIARKNLFQEKTRFIIAVGGVTFAVFLILIVHALYQGWNTKMSQYVENLGADIWILQEGTRDMFHSFSLVSQELIPQVKSIAGVRQVRTFIGKQVGFDLNGEKTSFFLVSFDTSQEKGGAVSMVKGKRIPGPHELIIDIAFAKNHNLNIGDTITINNNQLKIVGIAEGGNMIVFQYAFVRAQDADKIFQLGSVPTLDLPSLSGSAKKQSAPNNLANYLLVDTAKDQQENVLTSLKQKLPHHLIKTEDEFVEINQTLIRDSFLPIIFVLDIVGFLVGVAVIGLTIYTATIEKKEEFGVLKAIGAPNSYLTKIIFQQSLIAASVGFSLATILAYLSTWLIPRFVPAFQTLIRPQDLITTLVATLFMSFVAAYSPIRRISRIDPAKVFRA